MASSSPSSSPSPNSSSPRDSESPTWQPKRLIVCCDGTWMNGDGFAQPKLWDPMGSVQPWSNVTRISRAFKPRSSDGRHQVIYYQSGVGNASSTVETLLGGAFGTGISERIREVYSFICANFMDGDEVILVGFSRGAFTVRSVAGMVGALGLLTRTGIQMFYPIFKDMENWMASDYRDPFPGVPFADKPRGKGASERYRTMLEERGLTRVMHGPNGDTPITIKAVAVFDTVGSLGIPDVPPWKYLPIRHASSEYQFYDTSLSTRIEYAFQALGLDEDRTPFSPSVWERLPDNQGMTDLRQVWFPGNHANCGGGWADQGMANLSLAWMMDQLASVGCEFDRFALDRIYKDTVKHYDTAKAPATRPRWAADPIFTKNTPQRPWGLGAIQKLGGLVVWAMGSTARTPGLYTKHDASLGRQVYLQDTHERVHSSVRVRLACGGLGINDAAVWANSAMCESWRLARSHARVDDPIPRNPVWAPAPGAAEPAPVPDAGGGAEQGRWVWEYCGPEEGAPPVKVLVEESLGPYERYYLHLAGGVPNVWEWVEAESPSCGV